MNEQRKHFYTDHRLQGYLLFGLIVMEFALVLFLVFHLYSGITGIIENRMYRIHSADEAAWPEIFNLLVVTMGYFLAANIAALYVAHVIWGRYVKSTMFLFSTILSKIDNQEFSELKLPKQCRHQVIDLMQQWFNKEKKRRIAIASSIEALSRFEGKINESGDKEQILKVLAKYRQNLDH